jgi:hypothetical protein
MWYPGIYLETGEDLVRIPDLSVENGYRDILNTKNVSPNHLTEDVSWLRRLAADLSQLIHGLAPCSFHVGSVVDKVALGPAFF